jgi:hypothetical protein
MVGRCQYSGRCHISEKVQQQSNYKSLASRSKMVGYLEKLGMTWFVQILSIDFFAFATIKNVKWFKFQIGSSFATVPVLDWNSQQTWGTNINNHNWFYLFIIEEIEWISCYLLRCWVCVQFRGFSRSIIPWLSHMIAMKPVDHYGFQLQYSTHVFKGPTTGFVLTYTISDIATDTEGYIGY